MRYEDNEEFDSVPLLVRKMVWDIMPCDEVEDLLPLFGLIPSGEDVADMEHEESHKRLDKCEPIIDEIEVYSAVASDIMTKSLVDALDDDIPSVHESMFKEQNLMVIRHGVIAILAQLFDTGKIVYGEEV